MEFHISRAQRNKLEIDGLLFSYTGNVVFANVAASRKLANRLNEERGPLAGPEEFVNAGALFAMGILDELNHALIAQYRKQIDPAVHSDALRFFTARVGAENVERLLLTFVEQFPNVAVYRGQLTAQQWLSGATEGLPNREAALEELMLLWMSNRNPAFSAFRQLFDDSGLKESTLYPSVTEALPDYLSTRPPVAPGIGSLYDALTAPMMASPDSITGQLEFIREHWPQILGDEMPRILLAIDTLREEEIAVWMRFNPARPDNFRHGAPGFGGEGFVGDEYVGLRDEFNQEYISGPDGVRRRRYAADYQAPLMEYEAFSADQAWMPNVVLLAKSTYVWLEQLSKKYGRHIHRLDHIPDEELRVLKDRGITGLWLIGLWERSIASKTIKRLRGQGDAVASAYSLMDYNIAEDLGGYLSYTNLRDRAHSIGLRLASDMVPNHMGIDSPWVIEHPEWFLYRDDCPFPSYSFNGPDISPDSRAEIKIEDHYYDQTDAAVVFRLRHFGDGSTRYVYHGNDGTSFAWNDTAQLDYTQAHVREHVIQTILHVARQFPIIRFDAAMVLAKRHVQRLWFPLPGTGGSIPSRAENAITQEQFDALMPHEFWREVVDRVAAEVPGTLLLAEAFWLLEGYFVRTLGMHRVYNSAFMNMLRDEENAKYRSYLKKTIEFDPDILKRYVNFMSNPDERTSIDQFGSGDKYFGVCTLLATLPGLPMLGHGQIEGFTERYGMEFKRARMDESANEGLVARHNQDIAPLLKNRRLFSESTHFALYDFITEHGAVDENVFAYSNRIGDQRALIFYNNRYGSTRGSVFVSAAYMNKATDAMQQTRLADGLALPNDPSHIAAYRDRASGLEFLRRASDFHQYGLRLDLRGYQYVVLLDWRIFEPSAEYPWDRLCDGLAGRGVHSVDEALAKLRLRPLHEALTQAVDAETAALFAKLGEEFAAQANQAQRSRAPLQADKGDDLDAGTQSPARGDEPGVSAKRAASLMESQAPMPNSAAQMARIESFPEKLKPFVEKSNAAFEQILQAAGTEILEGRNDLAALDGDEIGGAGLDARQMFNSALTAQCLAAMQLPYLEQRFSTAWPAALRYVLPSGEGAMREEQGWAPVIAWIVLRSIPAEGIRASLFDRLHLRGCLAEKFASVGMDHDKSWRASARIRVLLQMEDSRWKLDSPTLWQDADLRWLAGVNAASEVTWFHKEQFEELLCWLQLPALLQAATGVGALGEVEEAVARAARTAAQAGYRLEPFLSAMAGGKNNSGGMAESPARSVEPKEASYLVLDGEAR